MPITTADGLVHAIVYFMKDRNYKAMPSMHYEHTLREGYEDCGMDLDQINRAIQEVHHATYQY